MLSKGFIKDTVNKTTFSENCYYTFGPDTMDTGNYKFVFWSIFGSFWSMFGSF